MLCCYYLTVCWSSRPYTNWLSRRFDTCLFLLVWQLSFEFRNKLIFHYKNQIKKKIQIHPWKWLRRWLPILIISPTTSSTDQFPSFILIAPKSKVQLHFDSCVCWTTTWKIVICTLESVDVHSRNYLRNFCNFDNSKNFFIMIISVMPQIVKSEPVYCNVIVANWLVHFRAFWLTWQSAIMFTSASKCVCTARALIWNHIFWIIHSKNATINTNKSEQLKWTMKCMGLWSISTIC